MGLQVRFVLERMCRCQLLMAYKERIKEILIWLLQIKYTKLNKIHDNSQKD